MPETLSSMRQRKTITEEICRFAGI